MGAEAQRPEGHRSTNMGMEVSELDEFWLLKGWLFMRVQMKE